MATYKIGNLARISGSFKSLSTGLAADPTTLKLCIKPPSGSEVVYTFGGPEIVKDAIGEFHFDLYLTEAEAWHWRWVALGVATSAEEGSIPVERSAFANPLP